MLAIQEEIKSRLKLGNACYYSVQNLLSSSLLSKKLKIKIYSTIILPVFLYGCETCCVLFNEVNSMVYGLYVCGIVNELEGTLKNVIMD